MINEGIETVSGRDSRFITLSEGFTLIEMIIVVVLLGVLAATALPRYIEVSGKAHESTVNAVGSAYAAAIALSHAQWVANGFGPGADVDDLQGFGDSNVNMSVLGWPVGVVGVENSTDLTADTCVDLWASLLQSGAPEISKNNEKADFLVTVMPDYDGGEDCVYTYQPDGRGNTIRYDADNGIVTTVLN